MAKLLDIIINPSPILRKRSEEIDEGKIRDKDIQELCADMALTMEKKDGVGLAAPQIGKNIRIIVVASKNGPVCFINPRLVKKSFFKEWGEEGCLSVPDSYGEVKRHKQVVCRYLDKQGEEKTIEAQGLMARVLQHEIDHLDGVLFIDKARNIRKLENIQADSKKNITEDNS